MRGRHDLLERPDLHAVEDVEVARGGRRMRLRFYRPSSQPGLPVLVFLHGGGFVFGDFESHDVLCRTLCARSRAIVVAVEYSLAPEHPFPAGLDDCMAAVRWVAENDGRHSGDWGRLALFGDSAGANLAFACACRTEGLRALVLAYPVADRPDTARPSYRDHGRDYGLTTEAMEWFWAQYLGGRPEQSDAAPLRASDITGLPATYILTAEFDPLRDEGIELAQALLAADVETTHVHYPTANHGFLSWGPTLAISNQAIEEVANWLSERLR